jgi:mannose-6-phosphate isomerase, class I
LPIKQGETVLFPASCHKLEVKTKGMDLLEVFI